jgi:geranylgeranyl diphosphate synthase type I
MLAYHFGYGAHGPARRGKRLRPTMLLRICQSLGAPLERALDAAAAVEMLHNYSLVHDDIEDRDAFRHGRPTLWKRYGVPQAVNAGDAICSLSFLTLVRAGQVLRPEQVLATVQALHSAHLTMCDGQSLDLQFEREAHVALADYRHMIACKTAALFQAACALGAICAGAPPEAVESYAQAGRAYGLAFQIRDDLLGIWASADQTGKSAAGDLARRKWTFPIVWALSQPPSVDRATIADAYATGAELEPEQVEAVVAALNRLGAREAAMRAIEEPMAVVERHPDRALRDYLLDTLAETVG